MKENTVNSRNSQDNGIRSLFLVRQNHSLSRPVFLQTVKDKGSQFIFSYLTHQTDIHSQMLHGQACIGHCPAGMDIHPLHLYQLSGRQYPSCLSCTPFREQGSDVNAYMSCRHRPFAFCFSLIFRCYLISHHNTPFHGFFPLAFPAGLPVRPSCFTYLSAVSILHIHIRQGPSGDSSHTFPAPQSLCSSHIPSGTHSQTGPPFLPAP